MTTSLMLSNLPVAIRMVSTRMYLISEYSEEAYLPDMIQNNVYPGPFTDTPSSKPSLDFIEVNNK